LRIKSKGMKLTYATAFDGTSVQFTRQTNKGFGFQNLSSLGRASVVDKSDANQSRHTRWDSSNVWRA